MRMLLLTLLLGCSGVPEGARAAREALLPIPASLTPGEGGFHLDAHTTLRADARLAPFAREVTGQPLPDGDDIVLEVDGEGDSYDLTVSESGVRLSGGTAGVFYGLQTLRQLIDDNWIASVHISDRPRFAWRGLMLDVARHFYGPDEIRRYIELASRYKLNRLHLHLTDDQGWRIEIHSWPALTAVGGSTQVGGGPGGFFTQTEYAELVAYAAERFVTLVPEIDMPGHCRAALSSYAALNCDAVAPPLYTGVEIGISAICITSDTTWQMLDDVVGELAALQPGGWLHVGGDETHQTTEADYITFMTRLHGIVVAHGLQMVGWEELARAAVSSPVQLWMSDHTSGSPIILSPATRMYLDMKYDSATTPGTSWVGFVDVDTAYDWDPADYSGEILGVEAALWTERISGRAEADLMIFPRLIGHAEIGWSPRERRSWSDYRRRLGAHGPRLEGIGFYRSPLIDWR